MLIRPVSQRIILLVTVFFFYGSFAHAEESPGRPLQSPINLRVVWTERPQSQAVVLWDSIGRGEGTLTIRNGDESKIVKASASTYPEQAAVKSKRKRRAKVEQPAGPIMTDCYTVVLKDLKPSTKYFLIAKVGDKQTKEHYFITAPDKDVDFKIFYAADSMNFPKAREVSKIIRKAFEKDPSYIALLHGGDYASKAITSLWDGWLPAYSVTTTSDGRLLPIIPVKGNHEGKTSKIFDQAYGNPGSETNYYTCMLSPQATVIILNTEQGSGEQNDFLRKELSKLQEDKVRFRMAAYHSPIYPAVKDASNAKPVWAPLFEKHNLDLGLEADGHLIKRTVTIRGDKVADDGVVYLGEGGYGSAQRTPRGDRWYLKAPAFTDSGEHYMSLSFTKGAIEYFTIKLSVGMVDSASFTAKPR